MLLGYFVITQASDSVNNDILLLKLDIYWIKGKAEMWFESYHIGNGVDIKSPN
jgi:hypothetical protein